jgi:hypothetical protein
VNLTQIVSAIEDLKKAIPVPNVGESAVDGLELVREDLQAEMAMVAPTDTPLRNRFNRIKGNGNAHSWYQLRANTDSTTGHLFMGTGPHAGFFPKTGLPTPTANTYKKVSASYVPLGDLVNVTLYDQLAGRTYTDIRQQQIKIKMMNVASMEEWAIIYGNSETVLASGGEMFDGLDKLIVDNVYDQGSAALSLHAVNASQQLVYEQGGKPQAIVMGYRDQLKFNELVLSSYYRLFQAGAGSMANIPAGINITKWIGPFGTVDIIGSRFITPSYGGVTSAFVIDDISVLEDGNALQMVDLMPISAIEIPVADSLGFKTCVAEFTALQMTAPPFQAKIINIGA